MKRGTGTSRADHPSPGRYRFRDAAQMEWVAGDLTNNALAGVAPGLLLAGVLDVLTMTGEYASGTIRATLLAVPRRPLVLAAKAAVFRAAMLSVGGVYVAGQFVGSIAHAAAAYMPILIVGNSLTITKPTPCGGSSAGCIPFLSPWAGLAVLCAGTQRWHSEPAAG